MKKVYNNKIIVSDKNGSKTEYDVLFTAFSSETNKNYIVYSDMLENESKEKYVYAYVYNPKEPKLEPIESDKEWDTISSILASALCEEK